MELQRQQLLLVGRRRRRQRSRSAFGLSAAVLLLLLFCGPVTLVSGRCAYTPANAQEQYEKSPFVVRLQYDPALAGTSSIPCEMQTWDTTSGTTLSEQGYTPYILMSVFKQDWSSSNTEITPVVTVGDQITVVYSTDTGMTKDIPSYIRDDPLGFMAYLTPQFSCQSASSEPSMESLVTSPFVMGECIQDNMGWSQLTDNDQAFLESLPGAGAEEVASASPPAEELKGTENNNNDSETPPPQADMNTNNVADPTSSSMVMSAANSSGTKCHFNVSDTDMESDADMEDDNDNADGEVTWN